MGFHTIVSHVENKEMKANEAKQLADKVNDGAENLNKELYNNTIDQIKRAASTGEYSTVITLDSKQYEAKAIAAKLTKDGFKVRYRWNPSEVGVCGVNGSYASLTVSWR